MNKKKMIEDILGSNETIVVKQLATLEQLLIQKGTITENEFNETYKVICRLYDEGIVEKVNKLIEEVENEN